MAQQKPDSHSSPHRTLDVSLSSKGVLTVKLNRPDIRNAFNDSMISELTDAFAREAIKPAVRIVVLRGEGPAFSGGGDLSWMKRSIELSRDENLVETRKLSKMFTTMNECPKPVIGLIHGAAIGGGVGLTSVCDIAVAEKDTVFSLSEVRLGIVPACIGPFVVSKIGASHARGLFMSAERFKADRALAVGLVHELVDGAQGLDAALERIVENMLQCGPNAMAAAKKLVLDLSWPDRRAKIPDALEHVSALLADLRVSPEGQEGLKAFLEKRKPAWQEQK